MLTASRVREVEQVILEVLAEADHAMTNSEIAREGEQKNPLYQEHNFQYVLVRMQRLNRLTQTRGFKKCFVTGDLSPAWYVPRES